VEALLAMAEKGGLGTAGALSLSVISSVAIVICNKTLITTLGFCFGMMILITFVVNRCWCWLGDGAFLGLLFSLPGEMELGFLRRV